LRQPDRVTLRGVVHAQVVADLADDDFSGVDADPRRELEAMTPLHLARELAERIAHVQRRIARALRVVLVRDRRAEQRHDPIAGALVERPFEAVDPIGEDLEEAIEDDVPSLGSVSSASSIEPFTSANNTVTCLRSPSRTACDVRIFSARCFGV